jgi:hypothetical protein
MKLPQYSMQIAVNAKSEQLELLEKNHHEPLRR